MISEFITQYLYENKSSSIEFEDEDHYPVLFENPEPIDSSSSNHEDYEHQEGNIVELHII